MRRPARSAEEPSATSAMVTVSENPRELHLPDEEITTRRLDRPFVRCNMWCSHILDSTMLTPERKKGSAEFLVRSLLEHESRHGHDLSKLIKSRSRGVH